jgi:chromosomal replication initiator protein
MKSILTNNSEISFINKLIKDLILEKFGQATFDSWFVNLEIADLSKNVITFKAKSKFIIEWIKCNYYDDLLHICKSHQDSLVKLEFFTDAKIDISANSESKLPIFSSDNEKSDLDFSGSINAKYNFDNFVTGEENIVAFSAAKNIANNYELVSSSQLLYIHSNVGLGKTHLIQSIANAIRSSKSNVDIAYFSSERFAYNYVKFVREGKIIDFKDFFSQIDVLLIDDLQFLSGKKSTQEELLHILNSFISENKIIVFTGDKSLKDLENIDKRLISKISAGFVTKINDPNKQLLARIVYTRFQKINISLSEYWLRTIIETIQSIRDIEGVLSKFNALKSINQKYDFDNLMHVILNDFVQKPSSVNVDIKLITDVVSNFYDVKKSDIKSSIRSKKVVRARQVIMYLAKELTSESLDKIGKESANRNHATVIYAIKSIESLLKTDKSLIKDLEFIKSQL